MRHRAPLTPRPISMYAIALVALLAAAAFLVACGGGGGNEDSNEPDAQTGPVRTATPYAVLPTPIIVTGSTGNTTTVPTGGGTTGGTASGGTTGDVSYTVVSGDTLFALASKYDTTVEAIMTKNGIASAADLRVGQQLTITRGASSAATATPGGAATATAVATPARTATPASGGTGRTYTVVNGDLAGSIAFRFSVTLEQLAAANNRSVASLDALEIGEVLKIPGS